jgi:hypothetical protein
MEGPPVHRNAQYSPSSDMLFSSLKRKASNSVKQIDSKYQKCSYKKCNLPKLFLMSALSRVIDTEGEPASCMQGLESFGEAEEA